MIKLQGIHASGPQHIVYRCMRCAINLGCKPDLEGAEQAKNLYCVRCQTFTAHEKIIGSIVVMPAEYEVKPAEVEDDG